MMSVAKIASNAWPTVSHDIRAALMLGDGGLAGWNIDAEGTAGSSGMGKIFSAGNAPRLLEWPIVDLASAVEPEQPRFCFGLLLLGHRTARGGIGPLASVDEFHARKTTLQPIGAMT
jgi:hypothetical protein